MPRKLLEKIFIKNPEALDNRQKREKYGLLASTAGIGCNILLFIIKLAAGLVSGSIAVMADAFNNLSDAGSSVVGLVGFRMSAKPADREHPFGHGRIEYIAGLIVSFLIMYMGLELFRSSLQKILSRDAMSSSVIVPVFLSVSILVKLWMNVFYRRVGREIDSITLFAAAQDSLNDVITTAAVLVSYVIFALTGVSLDGFLGLGVSVFIFISGVKTAGKTVSPLLGQAPDPALVEKIEAVVRAFEGITGVHDIVIHNYGPGRSIVTLHAEVPSDADIQECHEIIDRIEREIAEKFSLDTVVAHMDPIATDNDYIQSIRTALLRELDNIDPRLCMHDFRLVKGASDTRLIFDVVLPHQFGYEPAEFIKEITARMQAIDPRFRLLVQLDRSFA